MYRFLIHSLQLLSEKDRQTDRQGEPRKTLPKVVPQFSILKALKETSNGQMDKLFTEILEHFSKLFRFFKIATTVTSSFTLAWFSQSAITYYIKVPCSNPSTSRVELPRLCKHKLPQPYSVKAKASSPPAPPY